MTDEETPFTNLYDLLRKRGISPATLATTIEKAGIYGWDRYNRFKRFEPKAPEVHSALNVLAGQARHDDDPSRMSPFDDEGSDAHRRFGWPASELPDFAAIEAGMPPAPPRPQASRRSEDATLAIVGALLDFIKGKICGSGEAHPSYENETHLAEMIAGELGEFPGLSKSNLQKKFTLAKKLIHSPPD